MAGKELNNVICLTVQVLPLRMNEIHQHSNPQNVVFSGRLFFQHTMLANYNVYSQLKLNSALEDQYGEVSFLHH